MGVYRSPYAQPMGTECCENGNKIFSSYWISKFLTALCSCALWKKRACKKEGLIECQGIMKKRIGMQLYDWKIIIFLGAYCAHTLNLWVRNVVEMGTKFSSHIEFQSFSQPCVAVRCERKELAKKRGSLNAKASWKEGSECNSTIETHLSSFEELLHLGCHQILCI